MHISIIIPLYNRISLIGETLKSVILQQNVVEIECIVVDDGSTDGGAEYVEQNFPWVNLVKQKNHGAPAARNYGLKQAKGEYIVFLDSDDLLTPDYFNTRMDLIRSGKKFDWIYGPWDVFEVNNETQKHTMIPRFQPYPLEVESNIEEKMRRLLGGWFIPVHAILWKRDHLESIGGFATYLKINQDVDLVFRSLLLNPNITSVKTGKSLIRHHPGERQGDVSSEIKLSQILDLRQKMMQSLLSKNMLTEENKLAVGDYTFGLWKTYRKKYKNEAIRALQMSHKVAPNYKTPGGTLHNVLVTMLGNVKTELIKERLANVRNKPFNE